MAIIVLTSSKPDSKQFLTKGEKKIMVARTTTRTRKTAATAVSPAKTRTRKVDPMKEMVEEFVAAIEDGSLDGHLSALDAALNKRAAESGGTKRTRSTAGKSASAKPAASKTAAGVVKLKLEDLETGNTYMVKPGTQSASGVDISRQRVTFERKAKKGGQEVAKVSLNGKSILLPATSLTVAGRGRPPKAIEL